ncbi:hypothetical protein CsSME_00019568 [Camellia sinensis var. sinensis]
MFWLIEGLVAWRIKRITITFQVVVFALIATSSFLLISIPIVLASLDDCTFSWIGLVSLVGILNSIIS